MATLLGACALLSGGGTFGVPACAQGEVGESAAEPDAEADPERAPLTRDEARRALAEPLPADADARWALLLRQYRAALLLDQRSRMVETSRALAESGRGRVGWQNWIRRYLNAEFTWGSQGRATEAGEAFLADTSLGGLARAEIALRLAYFAAQGNDRAVTLRLWSRADGLTRAVLDAPGAGGGPLALVVDRLQVRSEVERLAGEQAASVATLRQAVGASRQLLQAVRARGLAPNSAEATDAYGWLDGSQGMLVYALAREGRSAEAIEIARGNLAAAQAGQLSEALRARWNYRLANALVETQHYDEGLAAARASDTLLARVGASAASQTRWLARQELVRALIGLRRWAEADQSYRAFLAEMPADLVARTRASDARLLALLAAKNDRFDEAIEAAERLYRARLRLFGATHPQTHEAAGVRAVVRLRRGEIRAAMADYEALFTATLDTPGGWIDLEARGMRSFVLGIAFDEFLRHVIERARSGERVDESLSERAMQIADRLSLGSTQRAIADSTARVLAATPALRTVIEQEQALRLQAGQAISRLFAAQGEEDRLRRETQTDAFKAQPEPQRRAHGERLREQREQVTKLQAESAAARTRLEAQRESIGRQFPAYAELVTPTTPRFDALRRWLQRGEAVLVVHPAEQATLVWLVGAEGRAAFAASALTAPQLASRVAQARRMLDIGDVPAAQRPPLQPEVLHGLYRELLGPLDAALRDVRSLIVATTGPLASLPLAVLVTEPPAAGAPTAWLVRRLPVTQLPSPASLQALRRVVQPTLAPKALLGFGDPLFDAGARPAAAPVPGRSRPGLGKATTRYDAEWGFRYADIPPLPETRAELSALAAVLGADPQADLVLGAQATRRAVLDTPMADRRVVAFATHGLMPGDQPGISKPALAMAATADDRESPLLELDDVLTLRLNAQWVLLSACNTAAGEAGGAAMSGLVRGFFFAGARSVLATHWAVETASAAELSAATFRRHAQGGVSRADSLRQAQLAMIDGTLGAGRWTHPFFWAPYALFGDPDR